MLDKYKNIIVIGAHPDDIEMGCAGLILRLVNNGSTIYSVAMSRCNDQFREEEKDKLECEYETSMTKLGVKNRYLYDFPNRKLPENSLEIMNIFNKLQLMIKPDLVLIPYLNDPHQDHSTVAYCAIRAFRSTETILQYEILRHGSYTFTPTLFVDITEVIGKKLEVLMSYESQISRRKYFDLETFKSLAKTRGAQSGYDYSEGFVVYKMFW
jgi:N-acetylglucosamine malate deacetylase 1